MTAFRERVLRAFDTVLQRDRSIGPLELFQEMLLLLPMHVDAWRKGHESYRSIEQFIQVGPEKFALALRLFEEQVRARGLRPIEAAYMRRTPGGGVAPLQVTTDGDPEREKFYRTHYAPADLPARAAARVAAKLTKAPDLVVFATVSDDAVCAECGAAIGRGGLLGKEHDRVLCLACADLDHLVFLPAGDTALSRRSRKHSPLSAVVVRFSRSRGRYERQGLLVTEAALAQAEAECAADAPARAAARAQAAVARGAEDRAFCDAFAAAIAAVYPGCHDDEARRIAAHAAQRGSGRVGRSAAGRALEPRAVELAVIAHLRHEHTNYDRLLMQGVERLDARAQVAPGIDAVLARWRTSGFAKNAREHT